MVRKKQKKSKKVSMKFGGCLFDEGRVIKTMLREWGKV